MRALVLVLLLALPLGACRTAPGPELVAERYVRALENDQLAEAYALTSAEYQAHTSFEAFKQRYQDELARRDRASEIRLALPALAAASVAVRLVREGEAWRVDERPSGPKTAAGEATATLRRFVDAAARGDFETAYRLLSAPLRARYTPERLQRDFDAEPLASERLRRAREALTKPPVSGQGGGFTFPIGGDKAVVVVREGDGFRVAALE